MRNGKQALLCVLLAAALSLALTACGGSDSDDGIRISGESVDINGIALRPDGSASNIYESGGMRLLIPLEYHDLLVVEGSQEDTLFRVLEKASVEAAKAQKSEDDAPGWLFSIGRISEDALHELLCYDMSGAEVFAKDADGGYYMYYHPTDVRIVRENYDNMEEDMKEWSALNEWAATVPETFLTENPALTPETRGNSELDIYLSRIAYMEDTPYVISSMESGPQEPGRVDPMPYVGRLLNGATYARIDGGEAPDGESLVLNFPEEDTRFDFFPVEGRENEIRMVWSDGLEQLYQAEFADGTTKAAQVIQEWYNALVAANTGDAADTGDALDASGFTGAEFVGEWQDSVSQRAVMSVKETEETGVYDILIHWGGSYNSAMQWRMKASAGAQDEILSYENGQKVEVLFTDSGEEQDTVLWEDGTGYLMFRDGFLTWYDAQESSAEACRFVRTEA